MKQRAVIILHPDFNAPGAEGGQTAKDWVEELDALKDKMLQDIINTDPLDMSDEEKRIAEQVVGQHRFLIRKVDV